MLVSGSWEEYGCSYGASPPKSRVRHPNRDHGTGLLHVAHDFPLYWNVTRFLLLQSSVPGFVGYTRCHLPLMTSTIMKHGLSLWFETSVGPTTPSAVKECSPFLSSANSDARSRVLPLAAIFCTASWNNSASTKEPLELLSIFEQVPPICAARSARA